MWSMIFAFSLVAMATVVMTVSALSLVRGLMGIGQFPGKVRAPQDADRAAAFPRHLVIG